MHAYGVQVHRMCLFHPSVFKCHFHFTSLNCYFLCTLPLRYRRSLFPWLTVSETQHHVTSPVPSVCVGMAEDTSHWTSPDRWTVKSLGTPVGTALEGHEQEHRMSHQPNQLDIPDIMTAWGDQYHLYITETQMGEVVNRTIQLFSGIEFFTADLRFYFIK